MVRQAPCRPRCSRVRWTQHHRNQVATPTVRDGPCADARHDAGRAHLGQVLGYWLSRSRWSFRQLQELTQWATGEARPLHSSAIAHVRNGNLRQPGFKIFEALDAVNLAVDDWQQHGADFCTQRYGPLPRNIAPSDLEGAIVLQHPATQEPITLCDWFLIFCGRLQLPCADTISITPSQAPDASTKLLAMIDDAIAPQALPPRAALDAIVAAYPVTDRKRQARLRDWIVRGHHLDPDTIEEELEPLAVTLSVLRGLDPADYTDQDLWRELIRDRRRS
jgi:hypothetical protein